MFDYIKEYKISWEVSYRYTVELQLSKLQWSVSPIIRIALKNKYLCLGYHLLPKPTSYIMYNIMLFISFIQKL